MNGKFLTALIIYMLTVCSGSQNTREMLRGIPQQDQAVEDYSETLVEYMSVDETITACTDIVMGKLLYVEYQNSRCFYHFSVLDVMKGDVSGTEVIVRQDRSEVIDIDRGAHFLTTGLFDVGKTYIIMLDHVNNVYEDRYGFSNFVCMSTDGDSITEVTVNTVPEKVSFSTVDEFRSHAAKLIKDSPVQKKEKKYILSDDIHEIADFADMIVKVRVNGVDRSNPSNRELIDCTVLDIYKGEPSGGFYPIVFDDTVEENKEYYMFLMYNGQFPTLAARDAVYPADTISIEEYIH